MKDKFDRAIEDLKKEAMAKAYKPKGVDLNIMTTPDTLRETYAGSSGRIALYIDGTHYHYIDVDADLLEGIRYTTASCGCCSDSEGVETSLAYELEYMDRADITCLVEELETLKTKHI